MNNPVETNQLSSQEKARLVAETQQKIESAIVHEFLDIQTISEDIRTETDNSDKDKVQIVQGIPKSIKEKNNNIDNLNNITKIVRQTLIAIKTKDHAIKGDAQLHDFPDLQSQSYQILRSLANSIDLNDVNENNAIYLNRIIKLGYEGQLDSPRQLVDAFNQVKFLEFIDNGIFEKIASQFQSIVRQSNIPDKEQVIESLKTESQKKEEGTSGTKTQQELAELHEKSNRIIAEISSLLHNITDAENPLNKERIERMTGDNKLTKAKPDEREQEKINKLLDIGTNLGLGFRDMFRIDQDGKIIIPTDEDIIHAITGFRAKVTHYFEKGIIERGEYEQLYTKLNEYKEIALKQLIELRKNQGRGLSYAAEVSGVRFNDVEHRLIDALDNPNILKNLVQMDKKQGGYNNFDSSDDWNRFYTDVKNLFERVFEIPQSKPREFWESAFDPLHEKFFYKMLLQSLRGLGDDIMSDDYFKNKKVWIKDFYDELSEHDVEDSNIAGHLKLTGKKLVHIPIGIALKRVLNDQMIDLQEIREYLHNTSIISLKGMGFDKMAEYSANLDIKSIDLLFHTTENLSEAYNFYVQSLYQELALNGHMMWTNFGKKNAFGLDSVEERVYRQLAALKGISIPDDKEIMRLIKMAGDLSKGVFGEFWGAAMTARFPLLTSVVYEEVEKNGKKVKVIDPVTKQWKVKEVTLGASYLSIHYPGLEKMLKDLDIDYQLQRFDHARYWQELRNAYAPRDLKGKKAFHDYYWKHHGEIYKYRRKDNDAFLQGRDAEMAEFDNKYVMWKDKMRTSSIDMFLRGAWRFYQYEKYFTYKKDENGKTIIDPTRNNKPILDFDETMKRMQGIGPYMVMTFIDDFFDYGGREQKYKEVRGAGESETSTLGIQDLASHIIDKITKDPKYIHLFPEYNAKGTLPKSEQKNLQLLLHKIYIFDRIAKMRPTHYLAMETMRFTTKGEELLTWRLEQQLRDFFTEDYAKNYIKGSLLPIYIGALELVENKVYQKKKVAWRECMEKDYFPKNQYPNDDPLDYELSEADFSDAEVKQALINYFHLAKTQAGAQPSAGKFITLQDEDFLDHIKTLFGTLKKGIDDPDHSRKDEFNNNQELTYRYASLMNNGNMGNIKHYFKGNLFDFSEFMFQQAGSRSPERMWAEVGAIATKMTPSLKAIIYDQIPELVKVEYSDIHAFEKAVGDKLIKPFKEWYDAIAIIDPDQGMREAVYLVTYIAQVMAKDRGMRYKVVGDLLSSFARRTWGTQGSLMTDHFWNTLRRPTTALDSDGVEMLVHTLLSSINMPLAEKDIIGYKKNWLGIQVPEFDEEKYWDRNMELVEEMNGVRMRDRLLEAAPIAPVIFLLIAFLLAKMALDKDKRKG